MTAHTLQSLNALKSPALVEIWNSLTAPEAHITSWKKQKDILVGRILAAQIRADRKDELSASKPGLVAKVEEAQAAAKAKAPKPEKKAKAPKAEKPAKKKREEGADTIRSVSLELLCEVAFYEDRDLASSDENRVDEKHAKARSVGLPYDEMLKRIKDRFPGAATTAECLRWYASHVRNGETGYDGRKLPQRRPRSRTEKPVKDAGF